MSSFLLSLTGRCCVICGLQLNTDWTQVEVITLVNDGTGLGFGIIGGKSTGVVVKTILPGGVADRVTHTLLVAAAAAVIIISGSYLASSCHLSVCL